MLIKEAREKSMLTKKAIEYYEAKSLICPRMLENGYRDYSEEDIATLKEISVLRKCGIGIAEIKEILNSRNKSAALAKCKYLTEVRMQRLNSIQRCLDKMIDDYDVDRAFAYQQTHDEDIYTIKERLVFAFPGNYGLFIAMHFGRFLNGSIDTDEKQKAYEAIIRYLDNVDLFLPPELSEFLEAFFTISDKIDAARIEGEVNEKMTEMLADSEGYWVRNRQEIEEYIDYKNSDEFKSSPAGNLQRLMIDFQNKSGYREFLVVKVKVLSPSYGEYISNLESANARFVEVFPQAKYLYESD